MTPAWLATYADLDDDALATLANKGLVRRGHKEAERIELVEAGEPSVLLRYTGMPGAEVRLLPGGPRRATCSCPVAGVCVHIVAACVWARGPVIRANDAVIPADAGISPDACRPSLPADVLAELLALDPAAVNRQAGVAAVRKLAAAPPAGPTSIEQRPGSLRISWADSPEIVAVPGGGFAGMLTSGTHSDVAERAWRLEALVRLFTENGRPWVWPEHAPDVVQPGQREAMHQAVEATESLLRLGLSRLGSDGVDRLTAAAQRARLEALPLFGIVLTRAAGRAARIAARADDVAERDLLDVLARAWALATALAAANAPLPTHLLGGTRGPGDDADTGVLVPLSVRWWTGSSGSRGLSLTVWDRTNARLETATTGRAAGADPGFARSWTTPLLWGASAETLAAGPFTLQGAERRDDGTLSATTRTRVRAESAFSTAPVDLDAFAESVNGGGGARGLAFLPPPAQVRLVVPRRLLGVGEPELDEINQELVWPITDRSGVRHPVRFDATGAEQDVIGWVLHDGLPVHAVLLDEHDHLLSLFVTHQGTQRLISPTLTPAERKPRRGWLARKPKPQQPRAYTGASGQVVGPIGQLADAVLDVCEALASTGRPALSPRQRDTLQQRARQVGDLGLGALADAVGALLAEPTPANVLRATLVADRTRTLAGLTTPR